MYIPNRVALFVGALAVVIAPLAVPTAVSAAPTPPAALLDGEQAMVAARESGAPVVATALTDEHTLVVADPDSGLLTATLSASVARVPDGQGGWRVASAKLVQAADGTWSPEAAAVDLTLSGGGSGPLVTMAKGTQSVSFDSAIPLPAPVVDDNLATYSEVAPGIDIVVRAATDGAEYFLVVKSAEAAQEPLVRDIPITASATNLTPEERSNGDVVYSDANQDAQFVLPEAYAWDSSSQPVGASTAELLDPAEGSALTVLDTQVSGIGGASIASIEPATELLDDPETVFPVVIDPGYKPLDETHALRVTETFHKYDSDIGSTAKIGYNGWSSPYYKSRMFYQFKWLKNGDGSVINSAQITSAKFRYKQTYSPQSDCSNTTFGPSVRVQPSGALSGDVSWSNQPSLHANSVYSSNDYAVGQNCGSHIQEWNVTSMLQMERDYYSGRSTVTLRIASADESNRNGWREYANTSSSPELSVTYEPEPLTPMGFAVTGTVATSPLTTSASAPAMTVTPRLASGFGCRQTSACMQVDLTLKRGSTAILSGTKSAAVPSSPTTAARINLPSLIAGTYSATVRTYNIDTKLYSVSTTYTFVVDLPPVKPTWSWVMPDGWTDPDSFPSDTEMKLNVAPGSADTGIEWYCVTIFHESNTAQTCYELEVDENGPKNPNVLIDDDGNVQIIVGTFGQGTYKVTVAARDHYATGPAQLDDPVERTFVW